MRSTTAVLAAAAKTISSPPVTQAAREAPAATESAAFRTRYVALEVLYLGWAYHGFAIQPSSPLPAPRRRGGERMPAEGEVPTIEGELWAALRRTRLVAEGAGATDVRYSRCGRTDKGVSALGQVVALEIRSKVRSMEKEEVGGTESSGVGALGGQDGCRAPSPPPPPPAEEMDYVTMLNKVLPPEVRVLGWCDVPDTFSARFSCGWREYKYFFLGEDGMDIEAMAIAAGKFVGEHDFRNFCKMDVENVVSFTRKISAATIQPEGKFGMYSFRVRGTAFLWNQVRCMMAVLMMVGKGQEKAQVVDTLLDIDAMPRKPQYNIADPEPLLLYQAAYPGCDLKWHRPDNANATTARLLHSSQKSLLLKNAMLDSCHEKILLNDTVKIENKAKKKGGKGEQKQYVPLIKRPLEPSFEEKKAKFDARTAKRQTVS